MGRSQSLHPVSLPCALPPRPPRVRNEIAAMLVYSVNSVEVELFCYVKASSVPLNLHRILAPCVTMLRRLKEIVIYTAWAVFLQILRNIAFVFLFLANPVMYS